MNSQYTHHKIFIYNTTQTLKEERGSKKLINDNKYHQLGRSHVIKFEEIKGENTESETLNALKNNQ